MREICLDEGTIQAFLDGELKDAQMATVTRHIALCDDCAYLLSEAEEESAFAFSALDGEMNTLVPTQRLWLKINDSIIEEKRQHSFWFNFKAFVSNLSRPSIAAFASLLIVIGLFAALFVPRPMPNNNDVAVNDNNFDSIKITNAAPPSIAKTEADPVVTQTTSGEKSPDFVPTVTKADFRSERNEKISAVKTVYVPENRNQKSEVRNPTPAVVAPQYLPGEETYIRTIANLSESVNSQKDTVMKPSARFSYEKDLAVINDAIDKMKTEVKTNPKNEAAKDILFASYQNKINLLNSVTERSELIASIR